MSKNHSWKYETVSYIFPIAMGIIFVFINYQTTRTPGLSTKAPYSFPVLLSIIIPLVVIWLIATYGAMLFKRYATTIKDSNDGKSLNEIADALILLVLYIILLPMANTLESLALHTEYLRLAVAIGNYLPLAIALVSVYLLYKGSRGLMTIISGKLKDTLRVNVVRVLCAVFLWAFLWRFYQSVPHLQPENGIPKFILPVEVLFFTYALPHVVLWSIGLRACRNLSHYGSKVPGTIYRSLYKDLNKGILLAYISIFLSQMFIISNISYSNVNIGIVFIYGLLLLGISGFIYVARGAKKLTLIEDT
jgi:hypothetical protein